MPDETIERRFIGGPWDGQVLPVPATSTRYGLLEIIPLVGYAGPITPETEIITSGDPEGRPTFVEHYYRAAVDADGQPIMVRESDA